MSTIDLGSVSEELLISLRSNITDPSSRGTTGLQKFSGNASTLAFTLGTNPVKNVISITIGGTSQSFGTDYLVNYATSATVITFTTAPITGTNNITVNYHFGTGGTWIYPDMPRTDLRLNSYPRVSLTDVSGVYDEIGLNADMTRGSIVKSITVYGTSDRSVKAILSDVKDHIISSKKSFYYFNLITPVGLSPVLRFATARTPGDEEEIVQQSIDCEIPFIFEN